MAQTQIQNLLPAGRRHIGMRKNQHIYARSLQKAGQELRRENVHPLHALLLQTRIVIYKGRYLIARTLYLGQQVLHPQTRRAGAKNQCLFLLLVLMHIAEVQHLHKSPVTHQQRTRQEKFDDQKGVRKEKMPVQVVHQRVQSQTHDQRAPQQGHKNAHRILKTGVKNDAIIGAHLQKAPQTQHQQEKNALRKVKIINGRYGKIESQQMRQYDRCCRQKQVEQQHSPAWYV